MAMIEGLGTTKKIEKVDILLSEAHLENGPGESWPCLLVKNTIFQEIDLFRCPKFKNVMAAGVNQPLPPVTVSSGRLRAEKN